MIQLLDSEWGRIREYVDPAPAQHGAQGTGGVWCMHVPLAGFTRLYGGAVKKKIGSAKS
jgi:hypothetical protein